MGSAETKAGSHSLIALCKSLKCPHFGSLGSPVVVQITSQIICSTYQMVYKL